MKRRDELLVGVTMVVAIIVIIAGALWLSQSQLGGGGVLHTARFRTVGGLAVGNPVVLRGVRVGRVEQIRLGEGDWVLADFLLTAEVGLGPEPAVIAASASLFGEWQASIISQTETDITDPNVLRELALATAEGGDEWPGATLPDIGQLTAQAGRIASDIGAFSQRIETAFNDEAVRHLQSSIADFGAVATQINTFAEQQTAILGEVAENVRVTSSVINSTATTLQRVMARVDTATANGALDSLVQDARSASRDLRFAMSDFRQFAAMVSDNRASVDRILTGADSLVTRLSEGSGTVGRLVSDSTLYVETSIAVAELRALLADIRENPRRYFKFSVF